MCPKERRVSKPLRGDPSSWDNRLHQRSRRKNDIAKPDQSAAGEATRLVTGMNTPEHLRTLLVRTVTGAQSQKATQGIPDDIYAIGDALGKFDWGKFHVGKYALFRGMSDGGLGVGSEYKIPARGAAYTS